jgi:hypothetical protein
MEGIDLASDRYQSLGNSHQLKVAVTVMPTFDTAEAQ